MSEITSSAFTPLLGCVKVVILDRGRGLGPREAQEKLVNGRQ